MTKEQADALIEEVRALRFEQQQTAWQRLKTRHKAATAKSRASTKAWLHKVADKL